MSAERPAAIDWQIQPGPCVACGATDYPLSMGGPDICPACDCYPPEKRVGQLAAENRQLRAEVADLKKRLGYPAEALVSARKERPAATTSRLLWIRLRSVAWVWKGTEHIVWFKPRLGHRRHYTQPYEPPKVTS